MVTPQALRDARSPREHLTRASRSIVCPSVSNAARCPSRRSLISLNLCRAKNKLMRHLPDGTSMVKVHKFQEQGSDVNLATYLLLDAFQNDYDGAAVITNDSDLAEPIRVVRDILTKRIEMLDPCGDGRTSAELAKMSTFRSAARSTATSNRPARRAVSSISRSVCSAGRSSASVTPGAWAPCSPRSRRSSPRSRSAAASDPRRDGDGLPRVGSGCATSHARVARSFRTHLG